MKFRKKPVVIEAVQITNEMLDGGPHKDHVIGVLIDPMRKKMSVDTLEGVMTGCIGDWIITGVKGEKYFCKPDIFEATYEKAE